MSKELSLRDQVAQLIEIGSEIVSNPEAALASDRLSDMYAIADDVEGSVNAHPALTNVIRADYLREVENKVFGAHLACSLYARKHNLQDPPKRKI